MDYIFIEHKNTLDYIKESDNLERIIVLDFNQFWSSIEKSFRNSDDIFTQFSVDIVRCNFFVNTCPINDSNQVKLYLDRIFHWKQVDEILMLCTQVLMGTPYEIISRSILEYNWYLSELSMKSEKDTSKKQMNINLIINNNEIKIIGEKKLRIFKLDENSVDINLFIVNILIEVDLLNKNKLLVKVHLEPLNK